MGRLVDSEEVKLMLSELLEVAQKEKFTAEDVIEHTCIWLDNIPTAYDMEKVVAELDKASFLMPPREKGHYADNGLFLEDAIDIVRKGWVE